MAHLWQPSCLWNTPLFLLGITCITGSPAKIFKLPLAYLQQPSCLSKFPFFSLGSPGSLDHQQRFSNSSWLAFIKPPVNQISPFFSLGSPGSLDHQSLAEKKCGDPQPWLTFTFSSAMDFNFLILKTYYWFMHQKVVILPWYVLWYHYSPSRIFVYHLK